MKRRFRKTNSLSAFCKALRKYDHFLLSCHVMPEGDAIGSMLAMDTLLRSMGKKTTVICEDSFPKRLHCLSSARWNRYRDIKKKRLKFDAVLLTDCATLERIGKVKKLITPEMAIFNIDHHVSNRGFGHFNFILPEAAASGEVVYDIYKKMRKKITKEVARNLYVAITTDTGSFRYGNTTAHTYFVASQLAKTGINLEHLNEEFYSNYSLNKIDLYSRLFARVRTTSQGKVAWVGVKRHDFKRSGANFEDVEGFVDFLKLLKEVKIVFIVIELEAKGRIKVSFRSKESYDVNKLASYFGGGGHKKASGFSGRANLENMEKQILQRIRKTFRFK